MGKFIVTFKHRRSEVITGNSIKFFSGVCVDTIPNKNAILLNADETISVVPVIELTSDNSRDVE